MDYYLYQLNEDDNQNTLQLFSPNDLYSNRISQLEFEESIQPERGIAGFVSKLYQCLEEPNDEHRYAHWCKHNGIDMFVIDCIPKFTEIVLPKLFKHCKFASFVRQLNIYGFQRDTDARKSKDSKDKESCRWHHIYFRPGRRDLFHLIRRKTPRYSRRKRQRIEEDSETILNLGSADESDTKEEEEEEEVDPQETEPLTSVMPFTDRSMYDPLLQVDPLFTLDNDYMETEKRISTQINEIRKRYERMCKVLTGEVNKAFNMIHMQRARIEFLESSLQQHYPYFLTDQSQFLQNKSTYHPSINNKQQLTFKKNTPQPSANQINEAWFPQTK